MPSICQCTGALSRAARHRWAAAWTVTLFISGCAPLPTTPEGAATATPTQAGAPIPEGPNARPSRWGWWSHDRKGAEALAMLPCLSREDIDPKVRLTPTEVRDWDEATALLHDLPTNDICYMDLALDMSAVPDRLIALVPLALRGVQYRAVGAALLLRRNLLIYGLGGLIVPFVGIKLIDLLLTALGLV